MNKKACCAPAKKCKGGSIKKKQMGGIPGTNPKPDTSIQQYKCGGGVKKKK